MTRQKLISCSISLTMALLLGLSVAIQPAPAKYPKASKHSKGKHEKNCDKKDGECKKDRKEMKITLTKSGGIMGMMKTYVVESKSLTPENATKLEELFDASKLVDLTSKTTPGAADLFFYEFKVEDGKRTIDVSFDDMSLPESVRPLLKFLMEYTPVENKRSTEAT